MTTERDGLLCTVANPALGDDEAIIAIGDRLIETAVCCLRCVMRQAIELEATELHLSLARAAELEAELAQRGVSPVTLN